MYIKSPINYIGGKYDILDSIIPAFPNSSKSFVDLFAGGMNVSINVKYDTVYVNDRVGYLIDIYKYFNSVNTSDLIEQIHNRISEFSLSCDNKETYNLFRDNYNRSRDVLDLFILSCFSFNHNIRFNNKHDFNEPFGMRGYNKQIEYNLIMFCKKLKSQNVIFSSLDFRDFDFSVLQSGDLVYCDPPYSITTASYNDGNRGFGGWSEKDDIDLFAFYCSFIHYYFVMT